jgi:hypothetical protein
MAEIKKIWNFINKGLTLINLFLLGILMSGLPLGEHPKAKKIPLVANIILLIVLVSVLYLFMANASRLRDTSI